MGSRVNKELLLLAATNCSQIAGMKNERLQAAPRCPAKRSPVCRDNGRVAVNIKLRWLVLGDSEPCIQTEGYPLALPTLGCIFPLSNI